MKDILDFSQTDNKLTAIMYLIFTFIFDTATEAFTLLVIFYFSPILLMVTDIISPMLLWVATTIQDGQDLPDTDRIFNSIICFFNI